MKRARFLEPAQAEFNDAVAYLNEQVPELGEKFAQEAQRAVNVVSRHPEIGAPMIRHVRKFPLRTFPYNVIYVVEADELIIIAVAHHKRALAIGVLGCRDDAASLNLERRFAPLSVDCEIASASW